MPLICFAPFYRIQQNKQKIEQFQTSLLSLKAKMGYTVWKGKTVLRFVYNPEVMHNSRAAYNVLAKFNTFAYSTASGVVRSSQPLHSCCRILYALFLQTIYTVLST